MYNNEYLRCIFNFFDFSENMGVVQVVQMVPVRLGKKGNLIICQLEKDLGELSIRLNKCVDSVQDESTMEPNTIYAFKKNCQTNWKRAMIKFVKDDGAIVIQLLDYPGTLDFNRDTMRIRKISDASLLSEMPNEIKVMIYDLWHKCILHMHLMKNSI